MRQSSRRDFLAVAAAAALAPGLARPAEVDPRVARIVGQTIGVDMHSHLQMQIGRADAPADPDIDVAGELRRSGFTAVCQTYNLDQAPAGGPDGDYKHYQQSLGFEDRLLARNHMRRALNIKDLRDAHAARQPIIVQSAEGAQFLNGKLERLEEAYGRGLRHLQLIHDRDDAVSPLGDSNTGANKNRGLTPFGAEVVKACNRLGILVDLAHGTPDAVTAALKVADRPMIISHSGMASDAGGRLPSADLIRRNITVAQAKGVAEAGGVIGVWWRLSDTLSDYVKAIRARVELMGVDHVGIGTDSDLTASYILPYSNKIWPDENGGLFNALVGEMLKQGFMAEEIGKIGGGNFCRVFEKATATS